MTINPTEASCGHCGGSIPPKPAGKRGPAPRYCNKVCQNKAKHRRAYVHTGYPASRPESHKHKPGNRYGALVLVERADSREDGQPFAQFRCDCGSVKELRISNVTQGITTNCAERANHPDPRRKDALTYDGAHNRVKAQRGSASLYLCRCGNQAEQWAYSHADYDQAHMAEGREAGMPYSTNPKHYAPMCRSCHTRWDNAHRGMTGGRLSLPHIALWLATTGEEDAA
ncbi:hypothetical protein ACFWDN_31325 [Micromonospora chalcea]